MRPLGREVPVIGFGCASLGSRVSSARGRAALEAAYAAGIRWYDVAPSYGDGEAESLLGAFVADKRAEIVLCTKVGIVAPRPGLALRLAKPAVRLATAAAPALRRWVAGRRPQAKRVTLTPELIERSVEQSLERLGTDHVDVIVLHEPTKAEAMNPALARTLERLVARGKARAAGIAGAAEIVAAGLDASPIYQVAQVAQNPLEPGLAELRSRCASLGSRFVVTHSVFGADGPLRALGRILDQRPELVAQLAVRGYVGSGLEVASAALLHYALSSNAEGVVLVSSYRPGHLAANLAQSDRAPDLDLVRLVDRLMGQGK